MRGKARALLLVVAATALALILAGSIISFTSAQTVGSKVRRSRDLELVLQKVLSSMEAAETGQRGFLLTREEPYLAPYERARRDVPAFLDRLYALTAEAPSKRDQVGAITELAREKLDELGRTVALTREGRLDDALAIVHTGHGRALMEDLRAALGALDTDAARALDDGRVEVTRLQNLTLLAIEASSVLFGFVGYLTFAMRRDEDRERRAEQLDHARVLAEQQTLAERAKMSEFQDRFVAILGHDLRNPLSSIMMAASLLQKRGVTPSQQEVVTRIVDASARMRRMVDQILDLARARLGGGIALRPVTGDIAKIAKQVVDEARMANPGRAIELDGETTLACAGCDPDRLAQVFSNLIGNAVTHGTPDVTVRVTVRATGHEARIEVTNGGQIPPERLPGLFDPFSRGEHESKSAGASGLGLGLYITREVVLAHGGRIEVTSSLDAGTKMVVTLPQRRPG